MLYLLIIVNVSFNKNFNLFLFDIFFSLFLVIDVFEIKNILVRKFIIFKSTSTALIMNAHNICTNKRIQKYLFLIFTMHIFQKPK